MSLTLKTFFLLLPIAWTILHGPKDVKIFILGGIFAMGDLTLRGRLARIAYAWPLVVLGGLYAVINFLSPKIYSFQIDESLDAYNWRMICATIFYAVPAGFCLASWGQKNGQKYTFLGYALFCLMMAVTGWQLIDKAGADQFVQMNGDEINRGNVDSQGVRVLVFEAGNLMIDAIPMSIFAVTAISATFASQWALPKLVLWFAAALGIYFNLVVATRTMILAAFATLAILVPVQLFTSQRRNRLVAAVFIVGALAGISALISLAATAGGGASPLLQRISNVGDDGRLAVWQEAIPLVFDYPAGGGIVHLSAESWGHNLFLDAALINGWLGTLVMFTLYGFIFFVVVRSIRRAGMLTQPVGIALTGGLIGSFMASMVHPPQPAFITFALLAGSFSVALLLESNVRSTQEPQPASPGRRLPKPGLVWASPA